MYDLRTYSTAVEYWKDVGPFLLKEETYHSRAIGVARRAVENAGPAGATEREAGKLLASGWLQGDDLTSQHGARSPFN